MLSLGDLPPCGVFLPPDADLKLEERYPLDLYFCETCGLSQLGERISPRRNFQTNAYLASHSLATHAHHLRLADEIAQRMENGCVVDIGCNDGMLLSMLAKKGYDVLGIDPSIPAGEITAAQGIPTLTEFFSPDVVTNFHLRRKADVICCTNTLQHVDDLHAFMDAVSMMLNDDGWFVFDVGHVLSVLREFHQIHHEYLTYFWSKPLCTLAELHGFSVQSIEMQPLHGGVLRAWMRKSNEPHCAGLPDEANLGSADTYAAFARGIPSTIAAIRNFLTAYKRENKRMVGYGASGRGLVLAHVCGFGDFIDACVDTTPMKIGMQIPGLRIPVISEEDWLESGVRFSIILANNLERDILERTKRYQENGGQFLRLLPRPSLIQETEMATKTPALQTR